MDEHMAGYIVGDPDIVRAGIDELLEATAADELMISTSAFAHADRRHSFELVSPACTVMTLPAQTGRKCRPYGPYRAAPGHVTLVTRSRPAGVPLPEPER